MQVEKSPTLTRATTVASVQRIAGALLFTAGCAQGEQRAAEKADLGPQPQPPSIEQAGEQAYRPMTPAEQLANVPEIPHPQAFSPQVSADRLMSIPKERRWKQVHDYGALCAQTLPLRDLTARASLLPDIEQIPFFDGAAHHAPVNFDDLPGYVAAIKRDIPALYQPLFFDSILLTHTRAYGDQPDRVLALAREVTTLTGLKALGNGIRIGLQQGFGDNLEEAIRLAARYPPELHSTLYEELGWRAGDENPLVAEDWAQRAALIPDGGQCAFAEGMARGRILRALADGEPWWPEVERFMKGTQDRCPSAAVSGITEALIISAEDSEDAITLMMEPVSDSIVKETVTQLARTRLAIDSKRASASNPPAGD